MKQATVIQVDPDILSGTPVFAGTRVPVQTLLEYFEQGRSLAEFLADFPTVTRDQAITALREAKEALLDSGAASCTLGCGALGLVARRGFAARRRSRVVGAIEAPAR